MFDFQNLDDVDREDAAPEWMKWQGVPEWQKAPNDSSAVLEDLREEQFAAPEDDYVYEKMDIPDLNEDTAFDPVGLIGETLDAVEDVMASYNGQIILNFITGAYEEYQAAETDKEQKKAYIDSLHEERLAIIARSSGGGVGGKVEIKQFDRKAFSWREVQSPFVAQNLGLPDGGCVAECALTNSAKILKGMTKLEGVCVMPPSTLVSQLVALAQIFRPQPSSGRMTRNTIIHLAVNDLFFPAGMIIDDAEEIISFKKGAPPTLVHLVAMSVNKEMGDLEPKTLYENIKLATPSNLPKQRKGQ
mmetsp:Transcript_25184/g.53318  ORF Transcript_25184/g.53318 Transcript_25184/m.53318 type:complete len:302 (+) Transcript_25184:68-973(+)